MLCLVGSKKMFMGLMRRVIVYWIFDYNWKFIVDLLIYIMINCGNSVLNFWLKVKVYSGFVSLYYNKMWL